MRAIVETPTHHPVVVDLTGYDRIRARTPERINARIAQGIADEVREVSKHNKAIMSERIEQLDHEWDVDRVVMMIFAAVGGVAVSLSAARKSRRPLIPLAAQLSFLALHGAIGWCPAQPVLRWLGFRSRSEIDAEKYALKTVRGDFVVDARSA